MTEYSWLLRCDGSSKGNPGPSGIGGLLLDKNTSQRYYYSNFIGISTNNTAEYLALIYGLQLAVSHHVTSLEIFTDSLAVTQQVNTKWRCKSPVMAELCLQAQELLSYIPHYSLSHVYRRYNIVADNLASVAANSTKSKP